MCDCDGNLELIRRRSRLRSNSSCGHQTNPFEATRKGGHKSSYKMNGFVSSTRDTSHLNVAHNVARITGHDRRLFAAVANKTPEWTTRKQARDNAFVRVSFFFPVYYYYPPRRCLLPRYERRIGSSWLAHKQRITAR